MKTYLGVDLGTSSVKAVLVDENLNIIFSACEDYPIYIPKPGYAEQDPIDWYKKALVVIKSCLDNSSSKDIQAISFSGQMHGLVILNDKDQVIRPAILWNDQRSYEECDYLNNEIGTKSLLKWTKNIAQTGFTAPKLLWLKKNELKNFNNINKIMLPKDYLAYKLSGVFATDVSDASGTLYFNVKTKQYSNEMLNILDISLDKLPSIYESNQKIGILKDNICTALGIEHEVDIIIGGGDQAVGAIGCNNTVSGLVNISLGTSGVIFSPREKCFDNNLGKLHSFCDATGKYHTMGVTLSAAGCVNWWYNQILKNSNYTKIQEELRCAKADNLFFLPYITGERSVLNDPNIRGSFHNLSLEHTQYDMTLSVIEGVSFCLKQIYDSMNINDCKQITVTSGGSKNDVWLQIIADIFNTEIVTINTDEGAAFGAAVLAISGSCEISVDSVYKYAKYDTKLSKIFNPSIKKGYYKKKYDVFKNIYPIIKTIKYE